MVSPSAIIAGASLFGLLLNTVGAFVALIPEFPWVRSYRGLIPILGGAYNEYEDRREQIRTAQRKIIDEGILSGGTGYNYLSKVIGDLTGKDTDAFSSIYYQDGEGIYPVVDEGENPDGISPLVLDTVIDERLQRERQDTDRSFLIGGLFLIGIGFLIQALSVIGEIFVSC